MVHVALLRGVNVGGANAVDMRTLRAQVERAGMTDVRTYINSGNVVFTTRLRSAQRIATTIESVVRDTFGVESPVVVRDLAQMHSTVAAIPADWTNDATMKTDVMFLWPDADRPEVLGELTVKPGIDDVLYTPGAVVWRADRANVTRSGLMKLAAAPLYQRMTVRNVNTARKLLAMMED